MLDIFSIISSPVVWFRRPPPPSCGFGARAPTPDPKYRHFKAVMIEVRHYCGGGSTLRAGCWAYEMAFTVMFLSVVIWRDLRR